MNNFLSIETGVNFFAYYDEYDNSANVVSVPLLARFSFFKYMYANVGVNVNMQPSANNSIGRSSDQSGLGFETGIGAKYDVGQYTIFINPFIQVNGLVKFNKNTDFNLVGVA